LKILKRPTQSPSPTPATPNLTKQQAEALRIEKERKYEQTRERIFNNSSPGGNSNASNSNEKKVWEADKEKGAMPIRGPKGPNDGDGDGGRGFARGRGRGRGKGKE